MGDFNLERLTNLPEEKMQEKQTLLFVLFAAWLLWFMLFLSIGI